MGLFSKKRQFDQYEANRRETDTVRDRRQTTIKNTSKLIKSETSALGAGASPALAGGSLYSRMYYPKKSKKVKP